MRIVITGATGFIGKALCRELHEDYELLDLTRNPDKASASLSGMAAAVRWDAKNPDSFQPALDGALAVINLAGENIGSGLWTKSKKAATLQSHLNTAEAPDTTPPTPDPMDWVTMLRLVTATKRLIISNHKAWRPG